jgi:phage terminase Nu1 subunit (DNA packaging protein)
MSRMNSYADLATIDPKSGFRPGSGRKTKEVTDAVAAAIAEDGTYLDYATARARKETAGALLSELDYKVKTREFVSRAAVQSAVASAMSAIAQTLRSIPDNIERKLGVSPEIAQEVGYQIDEAMDSLATELERMAQDGF